MRRAGLVVADALAAVRAAAEPGIRTRDLDAVAAQVIADAGATSNFLGYYGFPATTCVSVNEEIVHGIPGERVLADGDVVSVDCGAVVDGWHGDSAITFIIGSPRAGAAELVELTEQALWAGITAIRAGGRVADIGAAVEAFVAGRAGVVREYTGHGIGSQLHQPPDVPNYRPSRRGPRIRPGMCLAVEPMLTAGAASTDELDDEWTVVTSDGSVAAHWEHSVAVLADGLAVLTAADGGKTELGRRGVPVVELD